MDIGDFEIANEQIKIDGLKKSYKILQISDSHLVLFNDDASDARKNWDIPRVGLFSKGAIRPEDMLKRIGGYANSIDDLDAVILSGDIIDSPTEENIEALYSFVKSLKAPCIFVLGNHDWSFFDDYHSSASILRDRPRFDILCADNTKVSKKKIGELTFICVDDTMEKYEDDTVALLEKEIQGESNVFIVQHIPLACETLHEPTAAVWGRDICVGENAIIKNENFKKVEEIIEKEDVKAVITGHLHFRHKDILRCGVTQYVNGISAYGQITLYEIC